MQPVRRYCRHLQVCHIGLTSVRDVARHATGATILPVETSSPPSQMRRKRQYSKKRAAPANYRSGSLFNGSLLTTNDGVVVRTYGPFTPRAGCLSTAGIRATIARNLLFGALTAFPWMLNYTLNVRATGIVDAPICSESISNPGGPPPCAFGSPVRLSRFVFSSFLQPPTPNGRLTASPSARRFQPIWPDRISTRRKQARASACPPCYCKHVTIELQPELC